MPSPPELRFLITYTKGGSEVSEREKTFLGRVAGLPQAAQVRMQDKLDGFNMALDMLQAAQGEQDGKEADDGGGNDA